MELYEKTGPCPQREQSARHISNTLVISVEQFKKIVQKEQEKREKDILDKYVELRWREYCADMQVSDDDKRYYYRQFLLGRGERFTNPTPYTESSFEEDRRECNADIEEARQLAFLFLVAPHDGHDSERRECEIRNFRELYPGASKSDGNVCQEVMVYNKDELLLEVTSFIEKHHKKARIVIVFVGHGGPDGQIYLAGENCPLQEYIDCVDAVASKLDPPVPIDLINSQCYAHFVSTARSRHVNIIHLTNEDNPKTNSWCSYDVKGNPIDCQIIELQNFAKIIRNSKDADYSIRRTFLPTTTYETTQLTKQGFRLSLFPDPIEERFKCETCKLVLRDAVQAPCGHRHCKTCLDDFIRSGGGRRCPVCPEGAEGGKSQIYPDEAMRLEMHKLKTVCDQDGCGWEGSLRGYQQNHEKSCRSSSSNILESKAKAKEEQICNLIKPREEEEKTIRISSQDAIQNLEILYDKDKTEAWKDSMEGEENGEQISYLNEPSILSQEKLPNYISKCLEKREKSIKFFNEDAILTSGIGDTKGELILKQTEPDILLLEMSELPGEELEKRTRIFDQSAIQKSAELHSNDGVLNWRITDFSFKLLDPKNGGPSSLDSPPFYTSPCGYKMCCRIFLNGSKTGKRTHIGISFVLMPGQFDDQLCWPFGQSMSITLVDQKGTDPINITYKFIPDPTSSTRPISEQVVAGDPQFVSLRELYDHTETAYGKDDVLIIHANVD